MSDKIAREVEINQELLQVQKLRNQKGKVTGMILDWLNRQAPSEAIHRCQELIKQRNEFGKKKYGKPLMVGHAKSAKDALEEIADAMQYIVCARENGEDLSECKEMVQILSRLFESS